MSVRDNLKWERCRVMHRDFSYDTRAGWPSARSVCCNVCGQEWKQFLVRNPDTGKYEWEWKRPGFLSGGFWG